MPQDYTKPPNSQHKSNEEPRQPSEHTSNGQQMLERGNKTMPHNDPASHHYSQHYECNENKNNRDSTKDSSLATQHQNNQDTNDASR